MKTKCPTPISSVPSFKAKKTSSTLRYALLVAGVLAQGVGFASAPANLQDTLEHEWLMAWVSMPNAIQDGHTGISGFAGGGAGGISTAGSAFNGGAGGGAGTTPQPGSGGAVSGGGAGGSATAGAGGLNGGGNGDINVPFGAFGGGGGGGVDPTTGQGGGGGGGRGNNNGSGGGGGGGGAVGATCSGGVCGGATGGNGGDGGASGGFGGGGGGAGGSGTVVTAPASSAVVFTAINQGGLGGRSSGSSVGDGGGGAGGYGIFAQNNITLTLSANAFGGGGGSAGSGDPINGANGGAGGIGVFFSAAGQLMTQSGATITGGSGGAGGSGGINGTGGVAGSGGAGVSGASSVTNQSGAVITGGTGGNGGGAGNNGGNAASGGAGIALAAGGMLDNSGVVNGGAGGSGGNFTNPPLGNSGGNGGNGGHGGLWSGGGLLMNRGIIQGGNGGVGGVGPGSSGAGAPGVGGEGVSGAGLNIVDSGTIAGGLANNGAGALADAIHFTGGTNSLELQAGYNIIGNAEAVLGGNDALILGGATSSTLNASQIGAQYLNFATFVKIDPSTWTLLNTTSAVTPWTINQGTLAISSDGALGASSGTLTLNGGTLQTITNPVTSTRSVILGANGGTFQTDSNLTLNGAVSGPGSLTKTGAGVLLLNGTNTYAGGTTVNAGTLQAGSAGAFPSNTAYTVNGGTLDLNHFNLTASSLSGTGGTVNTGTATFTDNQSTNTTYAGSITGTGQFIQSGSGTLFLTGNSSAFAGNSVVNNGILEVDGILGGNMTVATGATLAGVGTIGGTVTVNGTIDPGDSPIGTLTVGNYIANPNSILEIEIDPNGTSSAIHALGTATINGGTVDVEKDPGVYNPGTRYTIVIADGGRSGVYNTLTQNMPFLSFGLTYDPNHVYLDITRNNVNFASLAATSNQINTANAAQSLGVGNAVYNAIASVNNAAQAQQAFDALSGEAHASTMGALVAESSYTRDLLSNRLYATHLYDAFTDLQPPCYTGLSLWAEGLGSWGELEGNSDTHELTSSVGGIFIGADQAINDQLRLGAMLGYDHSDMDVDHLHSHADSDDYSVGLYGGARLSAFRLAAGGIYTWHDIDTNRNVIFPNFANHLTADYNGHTEQVFVEGGYPLSLQRFLPRIPGLFEPFLNLAYVNVDTDSFTEHGGPAALKGDDNSQHVFYSTLGVRQSAPLYQTEKYNIGEKVMVGWQHTYDEITPNSTFTFASGSVPFSISGAPIARDSAVVDAGVHIDNALHTLQFRLAYIGQWADAAHDNGVTGTVTWMVG